MMVEDETLAMAQHWIEVPFFRPVFPQGIVRIFLPTVYIITKTYRLAHFLQSRHI